MGLNESREGVLVEENNYCSEELAVDRIRVCHSIRGSTMI